MVTHAVARITSRRAAAELPATRLPSRRSCSPTWRATPSTLLAWIEPAAAAINGARHLGLVLPSSAYVLETGNGTSKEVMHQHALETSSRCLPAPHVEQPPAAQDGKRCGPR
jgi:hypothetical protein